MNYKIILSLSLVLLSGCAAEQKPEANITQQTPEKTAFNEEQFVIDTFAKYDYAVPDKSNWIVKQEGPNKTAIIIKENINQKAKPDISKLIFLRNGDETKILHLVVKNKVII